MGSIYRFRCPGCDYMAEVSGGRDAGMVAVVKTMTCLNCKELVDVLIGRYGEAGPTGDPEYDKDLNICPRCGGHNIRPWPRYYPCPRCKEYMIKEHGIICLWD